MTMKKFLALILSLAFILGCSACGSSNGNNGGGAMNQAQTSTNGDSTDDLPVVTWKMASTWGSGNVHFTCDTRFAELVSMLTNGKFTITNYGEGELCAGNQCFDYVSEGTVQAAGDCAAYWAGKDTSFELLNSTVDNFTGMDYFLWINQADGLEVYQHIYGQYNIVYFPIACTWSESGIRSSKPINTLEDLKTMKLRMGSVLPGRALSNLGVGVVSVSGSEIYESMQRGVIDACEFSTPYADESLALTEVAKYWCEPCWFQSAGVNGVMINKDAYDKLPQEYKDAIALAASITRAEKMAEYMWNDSKIATKMVEQDGVTVTQMDDDSLNTILAEYNKVLEDEASKNPNISYILDSMAAYREIVDPYRGQLGRYGFGFVKD
mgnify:FL=1